MKNDVLEFLAIPPGNPEQTLRIYRYSIAGLSSTLVIVLLFLYHWKGFLGKYPFLYSSWAIIILITLFYVLFRTGLNKKFPDPSLTAGQILSAILLITYVLYEARQARGVFLLVYLMAFLFGIFKLNYREMFWLTGVALLGYGAVIVQLGHTVSTIDIQVEILQWFMLAMILSWFSLVGGYISTLRKRLNQSNYHLKSELNTSQQRASHDALTGVYNRGQLTQLLAIEKNRADRSGNTFCVCILDVDTFKVVNDTFGHACGDRVLMTLAHTIRDGLRTSDYFGRYGGEEFLAILTQTSLATAPTFAERMRILVEQNDWNPIIPGMRITVSIGTAEYRIGESLDETFTRADAALYRAKASGRNRVEYSA